MTVHFNVKSWMLIYPSLKINPLAVSAPDGFITESYPLQNEDYFDSSVCLN